MHYTNLFTSDSGTKTGFFFLGLSVVCSLGKSCPHNRKDVFNSILSWVLWFLWAIGLCSKNSPGTGTGKGMGRPKFCPRRPPWDLALGSSMPLTGLARPGAGWERDLTGSASQAVRRGETVVRVECDADERYSRIPAGPAGGPGEAMNTQELLCLEPRNHVLSSFGALDKGLQAPFRGHCAQLHPWQTTVSCGCGTDAVGIHSSCIQAAVSRRNEDTRMWSVHGGWNLVNVFAWCISSLGLPWQRTTDWGIETREIYFPATHLMTLF